GKTTTTTNHYDGAGNLGVSVINGGNFGFFEVTYRDVRYDEIRKQIEHGWAEGAAGLAGSTRFERDRNGQLIFLDRGRASGANENTVARFSYDNDGHILTRADASGPATDANYFQGFPHDPETTRTRDDDEEVRRLIITQVRRDLFGHSNRPTELKAFVYVNGHPVADAQTHHRLVLKKLTLQGATPIERGGGDEDPEVIGHTLALIEADIARHADGTLNRHQTAINLATRAYAGFAELSEGAQARVLTYIKSQLPLNDADVKAGAQIELHGYLLLVDGTYENTRTTTDYFFQPIGKGTPQGQAIGYVIKAGDTLQSIAAQYYGSPSYWYLIAAANGLAGSEPLKEGTSLTVPNRVSNLYNHHDTYKLYNENEIIGSTSPEIVTIPKPRKKKKWYQK
ncbi:MAG TPA: LysM peptidoglycan-binding domain-containing protein, partial [Alphaproteobacteria bacterium]|nr:LysM peptidoglycan-binding domain-containing protein [Alphaproteobacteria bacterium]